METNQKKLSWYPGHIAKAINEMAKHISMVDVVVHIVDSRAPGITLFDDILKIAQNKPVILYMNKSDLADQSVTKKWAQKYIEAGFKVLYGTTNDQKVIKQLKKMVANLTKEKLAKYAAKGLLSRTSRVMITGMPNVGKSTLINKLIGQSKTKVANKPGVTRQVQWVRIAPDIELLDTPGVLPLRQDDRSMHILAMIGMVGEKAFDDINMATFIYNNYREIKEYLHERYHGDNLEAVLTDIAKQKGYLAGGQPEIERAATFVLKSVQNADFHKWSFERP